MLIQTSYHESNREEMVRFITNHPKTSLEVGCRGARHSKLLKETGIVSETWGIEPDDNPQIIQEATSNLDYFKNEYFNAQTEGLPENYFDLIIFNDVLEHMYDPWSVLLETKKFLSPDGIVVISLPNIRHKSVLKNLILHDTFEYTQEGLLDITHIRFFTQKTMEKMVTDCGYEIVKFEPISPEKPKLRKKIFDFLTKNRFKSSRVFQFGITAKVKKGD